MLDHGFELLKRVDPLLEHFPHELLRVKKVVRGADAQKLLVRGLTAPNTQVDD